MGAHLKIFIFFAFAFLNSVVAQRLSSQTEWRALLKLRSSLGIAAKDWRKKANPCLNWTGIECGSGRVIGINLSGLRRTRQGNLNPRFALDSLPSFPLLSSFNSTGFSLPGSIPDWLGQRLSNLEVLDLSSCSIYGPLPSSIGNLSRLRSLHLSNNSIAGTMPTALGKLLPLSVLDLSRNLLTGQIPREIASLMNLSKLDLSSNFLSGGIPLEFGSLSSLEHLNLSNNNLNAVIPAQLGNISRLIELDLGLNSFFGSLPNELGGLRSLKKMVIGNNELGGSLPDDLFQKLVRLDYLVLSRNYFVGALPDSLWSMSHLKYLDVSGNNLTGAFSIHIASLNITGAVFNFSNNQFYGNLSRGIGKLHTIDISSNYFEGSAPNDSRISIILANNCFLRVPGQRNRDLCVNFYSERGISFGNETVPLETPLLHPAQRRKRLAYVMVGVFGGLGFIVVLITLILLLSNACNSNTRKTDHQKRNAIVSRVPEGSVEPSPKALIDLSSLGESFTHEQMLLATHNFSTENFIKDGHSGDIFRGNLENGLPVVIKRVDLSIVRKESFMSELDIFGKVMHPRLVPLVGHCLEDEQKKYLVYKYMPNGDLSNAFYRLTNVEEDLRSLDWITRLKIAIGAAEALSYLHHECSPPVVHRYSYNIYSIFHSAS